jgi:peptidyl-prolyl cis-trans isomerase A (cyclophilin A)
MKTISCVILAYFLLNNIIAQPADSINLLQSRAPKIFQAVFETSKGEFIIEANRNWSPNGVDRFYQLVASGFYNNTIIYRSTAQYVQFGISNDSALNSFWERYPLKDEKVKFFNTGGTVTFGSGGPDTRVSQIFINKVDNPFLDTLGNSKGFPPFGKIIAGMDVVNTFFFAYGDEIAYRHQDSIYLKGNAYLQNKFPLLDSILRAYIR